jgi:flavorubredoxin
MFENIEIAPGTYYVGVNDRSKHLFENMWPLPYGVSYNSYLIVDEKIALVDTADICYAQLFIDKIESVIGDRPIDYLIVNHMEPDHSGSIRMLYQKYPNMQIVGNSKTFGMIEGFYGITDRFEEVKEGDKLNLGQRTFSFHLTPMVHWPETMMTYDKTNKILFAGDAFGCFGTLDGAVIDEDLNLDKYWDEMYRYYANIVGKYGGPVQKALHKLGHFDIQMICSTHGPIWKKYRQKAIAIYDKLSRYDAEVGVVIAYGSMYGNTEQMAEAVALGVAKTGIKNIVIHDVSKSHPSYILSDIFKYKGLIIGSPTYSNELYPNVKSLCDKLETRDIKHRVFGCFGSFAWAGTAAKALNNFGIRMKWDVVDNPVEMKQGLKAEQYDACVALGKSVGEKILALNL